MGFWQLPGCQVWQLPGEGRAADLPSEEVHSCARVSLTLTADVLCIHSAVVMGYKSEESQALLAPREVVASQTAVAVAADDATAERDWDGACYQVCGPQCDSTGVSSCALAYLMPCVAFGCVIPVYVTAYC